jgi:DNA mismatch repair protein MutS
MNNTDVLTQFDLLKVKHPTPILLIRDGDFYKSFREDATSVSKIAGVALTEIQSEETPVPYAEFNYHFIDQFLPLLVKAGSKVGICDRLENPPEKH